MRLVNIVVFFFPPSAMFRCLNASMEKGENLVELGHSGGFMGQRGMGAGVGLEGVQSQAKRMVQVIMGGLNFLLVAN